MLPKTTRAAVRGSVEGKNGVSLLAPETDPLSTSSTWDFGEVLSTCLYPGSFQCPERLTIQFGGSNQV